MKHLRPYIVFFAGNLLFLVLLQTGVFAQTYFFRSFSLGSALIKPEARHMAIDGQGLMWVSSAQTLMRYNGQEFTPFDPADTLPLADISKLGKGASGELWIGYQSGELATIKKGVWSTFRPEEGTPKVPITGFGVDDVGRTWISTYGEGLYYVDKNNRLYNVNTDDGLPGNDVYTLEVDQKGQIWAGTDQGIAICRIENGKKKITVLGDKQGLSDEIVLSMDISPEGDAFAGTYEGGVFHWLAKEQRFVHVAGTDSAGAITSLQADEGQLFFGTRGNGIWHVAIASGHASPMRDYQENLGSLRVNQLLLDPEGNLWVAANRENIIAAPAFISLNNNRDLQVQAVLEDRLGRIWYATSAGLNRMNHSVAEAQVVVPAAFFNQKQIVCIYQDRFGLIWIGTFGGGLYRLDPANNHCAKVGADINENIFSITERGNEIWFGTFNGLYWTELNPYNEAFNSKLNFFHLIRSSDGNIAYVYQLLTDSKGRIWCATDGHGLTTVDKGSVRKITNDSIQSVYSMAEDGHGRIWFSTDAGHLYFIQNQSLHRFKLEKKLGNTLLSGLVRQGNDHLLITYPQGAVLLNTETGYLRDLPMPPVRSNDDAALNASCQGSDGQVWWGGAGGLIHGWFGSKANDPKPSVFLRQVLVYLLPHFPEDSLFSYRENHISFDYTGIWYQAPEKLRFQHRLIGYDIEWVTSRNPMVSYPRLSPGYYVFELRASASDDFSAGEIVRYTFHISRPFWQTPFFWVLAFVAVATSAYFLLGVRDKRMEQTAFREKERIRFEFETLKNQVNPHFLFNSFNTLVSLIEEDRVKAVDYVNRLSELFRNILTFRDQDRITLREELEILENYVYLQKERFGERLKVLVNCGDEWLEYRLPPMSLQMLIENAVKHNVISRQHELIIQVTTWPDGYLMVENRINRKRNSPPSTGLGLSNIQLRYQLLSEKPVRITSDETFFRVSLPLLKPQPKNLIKPH